MKYFIAVFAILIVAMSYQNYLVQQKTQANWLLTSAEDQFEMGNYEAASVLAEYSLVKGANPVMVGDYTLLYAMQLPRGNKQAAMLARAIEIFEQGDDTLELAQTYLYVFLFGGEIDTARMREVWLEVESDRLNIQIQKRLALRSTR